MPGIFGAHEDDDRQGLNDLMERMALSMKQGGALRIDQACYEADGLFMGRVSLGVLNAVDQPVRHQAEDCRIVFHGELYGRTDSNDPLYMLNKYVAEGDRCVEDVDGVFHFAIFDGRTRQIKLFSDKFGLQPLYYSILPEGLVFGAEVKAVIRESRVSKTPDYRALADFLHYGEALGQKTLFRDVTLLAPGSVLTYDMATRRVSVRQYWDLLDLFAKNGNYTETSAEETVKCLVEAIRKRAGNRDILGLSLSAGLDSRAVLAGLQEMAKGIRTYTLGLPGCADERLAGRMAGAAGTRHEFVPLVEGYLEDFDSMALDMTRLSDGMYHPYESTEMLALDYFRKAGFKVLLRGHGGEIAKAALAYPVMVRPEAFQLRSGSEVLDYIFTQTNLVMRDIDIGQMFNTSFLEHMKEGPRESLQDSCGAASEVLSAPDLCIYYYITERIRRQVVASLDIFRTEIEVRMPYVDEQFIRALLKLPVQKRNRGEIQFALVKRCMPELIAIPDSNTGAPLDAGPLRLLVTDKFNSLMKRLSVKGFRHYTEFHKWHRERFKENTERIIFSEKAADRGIYNQDHLRSVFNLHISGEKNYGQLLGTVVGLELWFRTFVE